MHPNGILKRWLDQTKTTIPLVDSGVFARVIIFAMQNTREWESSSAQVSRMSDVLHCCFVSCSGYSVILYLPGIHSSILSIYKDIKDTTEKIRRAWGFRSLSRIGVGVSTRRGRRQGYTIQGNNKAVFVVWEWDDNAGLERRISQSGIEGQKMTSFENITDKGSKRKKEEKGKVHFDMRGDWKCSKWVSGKETCLRNAALYFLSHGRHLGGFLYYRYATWPLLFEHSTHTLDSLASWTNERTPRSADVAVGHASNALWTGIPGIPDMRTWC